MKVYIVLEPINFDEEEIIGVYKSKIKAEKLKRKIDIKLGKHILDIGIECKIEEHLIK